MIIIILIITITVIMRIRNTRWQFHGLKVMSSKVADQYPDIYAIGFVRNIINVE
jgi:hypothetical protein